MKKERKGSSFQRNYPLRLGVKALFSCLNKQSIKIFGLDYREIARRMATRVESTISNFGKG